MRTHSVVRSWMFFLYVLVHAYDIYVLICMPMIYMSLYVCLWHICPYMYAYDIYVLIYACLWYLCPYMCMPMICMSLYMYAYDIYVLIYVCLWYVFLLICPCVCLWYLLFLCPYMYAYFARASVSFLHARMHTCASAPHTHTHTLSPSLTQSLTYSHSLTHSLAHSHSFRSRAWVRAGPMLGKQWDHVRDLKRPTYKAKETYR